MTGVRADRATEMVIRKRKLKKEDLSDHLTEAAVRETVRATESDRTEAELSRVNQSVHMTEMAVRDIVQATG